MGNRCYYVNISATSYQEKYVAQKHKQKQKQQQKSIFLCLCISRKQVQHTVFRLNLNLRCSHPPTEAAPAITESAKLQHLLSVTQASHKCHLMQMCKSFTAQGPSLAILSCRSELVHRISAQGVKLNTQISESVQGSAAHQGKLPNYDIFTWSA